MKTRVFSLICFVFLFCSSLVADTTLRVTLSSISGAPGGPFISATTNRNVHVFSSSFPTAFNASVTLQDLGVYVTDTTGTFYLSNVPPCLLSFTVMAPPQRTDFSCIITSTNLGTIGAETILAAASTATFPAGTVAYSAATSDARYARNQNTFGNLTNATPGVSIGNGVGAVNNATVTVSVTNLPENQVLNLVADLAGKQPLSPILTAIAVLGFVNTNSYAPGANITMTTNSAGVVTINGSAAGSNVTTNNLTTSTTGVTIVGGTGAVFGGGTTVDVSGLPQANILGLFTSLTGLTNLIGTYGVNGTNFALTLGQNSTNFSLTLGQNSTNYATTLALNNTNFTLTIANNNSNWTGIAGANGTNFTLTIANNNSNWTGIAGANGTNFTLTIANNNSNWTGIVGANDTNYTITATNDLASRMALALTNGNILYLSTNGNDFTAVKGRSDRPWKTFGTAVSNALSGDIVYMAPGIFYQSNNPVIVPQGVSVLGSGLDISVVAFTNASGSGSPSSLNTDIQLGDNQKFQSFSIVSTNSFVTFVTWGSVGLFPLTSSGNGLTCTNTSFLSVGIYTSGLGKESSSPIVFLPSGSGVGTNTVGVSFSQCKMVSDGSDSINPVINHDFTSNFTNYWVSNSIITFSRCTIVCQNATIANGLYNQPDGGFTATVRWFDNDITIISKLVTIPPIGTTQILVDDGITNSVHVNDHFTLKSSLYPEQCKRSDYTLISDNSGFDVSGHSPYYSCTERYFIGTNGFSGVTNQFIEDWANQGNSFFYGFGVFGNGAGLTNLSGSNIAVGSIITSNMSPIIAFSNLTVTNVFFGTASNQFGNVNTNQIIVGGSPGTLAVTNGIYVWFGGLSISGSSGAYSNLLTGYVIYLQGGTWFIATPGGASNLYSSSSLTGTWINVNGGLPVPSTWLGARLNMGVVNLEGYVASTNLDARMRSLTNGFGTIVTFNASQFQASSLILSNLVTIGGAQTNSIVAGSNVLLTTNAAGVITISASVLNTIASLNGFGTNTILTNGIRWDVTNLFAQNVVGKMDFGGNTISNIGGVSFIGDINITSKRYTAGSPQTTNGNVFIGVTNAYHNAEPIQTLVPIYCAFVGGGGLFGNTYWGNVFSAGMFVGDGNTLGDSADYATVIGGRFNILEGQSDDSTILTSTNSYLKAAQSAIIGGGHNIISSTVQDNNNPDDMYAGILWGRNNTITNSKMASIIGGTNNVIYAGTNSIAMGQNVLITNNNVLAWADGQSATFNSTTNNMVIMRAQNGFLFQGGQARTITTITANYTLCRTNWTLIVDTTGSDVNVTLPGASGYTGFYFNVKNVGTNRVIFTPSGADRIDKVTTFTNLIQFQSDTFQSDGVTNWWRM